MRPTDMFLTLKNYTTHVTKELVVVRSQRTTIAHYVPGTRCPFYVDSRVRPPHSWGIRVSHTPQRSPFAKNSSTSFSSPNEHPAPESIRAIYHQSPTYTGRRTGRYLRWPPGSSKDQPPSYDKASSASLGFVCSVTLFS